MNKFRFAINVLAITIFMFAFASLAQAQATRTWVSGVGDDANPCSRTAPCKTFAGSISKTAVNGEINCLDSGGFGAVTITKSITIKCEGTIGGILAAGVAGVIINDSGGTAIVTLSGLDIEGAGTGTNGINFINGAILHVHKTQIRGFRQSGAGGNGILINPSTGTKTVFVADCYITDNGATVNNAGILVKPTSGASVNLSVNRTQFENNFNGIYADGSGGGGVSNIGVKESVVGGSANTGIVIVSSGASFSGVIDSSMLHFNASTGAAVAGSAGTLRLGNCTIANNLTGVANFGGTLQSFKNNQLVANGTDGAPITPVSVSGNILN